MARVTPTRSELLARRAQIVMATRGRDVLREKREQLMQELRRTGDDILTSADALEAAIADGRRSLARAEAIDGPESVRSAALAVVHQLSLATRVDRVMGVRIAEITSEATGRARSQRGYALAGTTGRIDEVADRFESVTDRLLDHARYELRLRRLADEIRTTTRRVNALETVVIPQLERDCAEIRDVLDERERQDRFRLKRAVARRRSGTRGRSWATSAP